MLGITAPELSSGISGDHDQVRTSGLSRDPEDLEAENSSNGIQSMPTKKLADQSESPSHDKSFWIWQLNAMS